MFCESNMLRRESKRNAIYVVLLLLFAML